jgi:heavy metal efflux system protein
MNKLIQFSLRSRILVSVFGIVVMIAGWMAYQSLPVNAFPDVSPSLVQIFTVTEGLAPEEIEQYVTYPIETAMNGLPRLDKVRSVSNFGLSVVNIYFEDGTDIYFARQVVGERLREAIEQIPDGFGEPVMGPISTGMGLVLFYYLDDSTGQYSLEELRTMQDWIVKYNLQTVPGVTEVLGIGGFEKQFQVNVDPLALLQFDLSLTSVLEIIEQNNLNVGAQFITKNSEQYVVRSVGLATDLEDLKNMVVKTVDGTPVYLKQIADIKVGGAIRKGLQTRNGTGEVISGMVVKLYGSNSSIVIKDVEEKLKTINEILPEGVKIVPYYEQKSLVEAAVSTVTTALWQGIVLVALVLLLFMGSLRPSLVVALSIPFSALFATFWMQQFGISADLMSLGGLAIAIGMMVDGTIVMVENVDRLLSHASEGESRIKIVAKGCAEVARPVLFAILIIVVVFTPLFLLEGVEGITFRPLAYTVALAMIGSLVFALILAPVLSDALMRRQDSDKKRRSIDDIIVGGLTKVYSPIVHYFVRHRRYAIGLGALLLIIGGAIFPFLGSEFTPTLQEGTLVLRLTMAPSIALENSGETALLVERRLMKVAEIQGVVSRTGRGEVGAHTDPVNSTEMYLMLAPKDEWRVDSQEELQELIRSELGNIPGVLTNFTQPIQMTVDELLEGVRAELAIKLFGDDLDVLKEQADEIAAIVGGIRGAADVQPDQISGAPQLRITIDHQAIARFGVNVETVQRVIETAVGGSNAGQIFEGVKRFDIYVRYNSDFRSTPEQIGHILIPTLAGALVPLSQLTQIDEIVGPRQITRENNQRFITIQLNVNGRDIGSFVEEAQAVLKSEIDLPTGYFTTWGGQFRLQQDANARLMVVVPMTLLFVFLLLFGNFNSLPNALLIIMNIPLALVGGIVGLWITGQNMSVPASVGFIALFGISLQNGMVLVTYMNQLITEGLSVDEASVKGAVLRLRPVLMTACTTALGLIPLLLSSGTGSEVQRPLATVVIGGLVTSTILTLLVIPALYKWFQGKNPVEIEAQIE